MLESAGLQVVICRKLKPKDDTWITSAFYVACSDDCAETFYNAETWPDGAELRDWYYES